MKNDKENKTRRTPQEYDFSSLDREIGSFGIEPPKHYRPVKEETNPNQPRRQGNGGKKKQASKKRPLNKKKPQNLTNQQEHKKNTKKRRLKKKVRKALSTAVIAILLVIVIIVALVAFAFKIDTITVQNNKKYTNEQITAVLPIQKEKSLFLIDKDAAIKKLETNLPYVYKAEIKRKLPSTIIVNVTEPSYVFYIKNADKSYTLLDDNFKVLEANVKSKPKNSIELRKVALKTCVVGETAEFTNEKLMKTNLKLSKLILKYDLKEISAIYCENSSSCYMVYDKRVRIKLGDTADLDDKIFSALTAMDKLNDSNPSAKGTLTSTGGKQVYFTENK